MTPADIADLAFHLRSDTGLYTDTAGTTAATADGALVARWSDLGPNGWHVTQATSGNRPTLEAASSFKSKPAVRFVGSSSQFLTNTAFNATSGVSAGTWFLCFQTDGTGTSAIVSPTSDALGFQDDNGTFYFYHHGGAAEHGHVGFYRPSTGKCVLAAYDAAGTGNAGRLTIRANTYDRTLLFDGASIEATAYTVAAGLSVGKSSGGAFAYATARILEVAFWPRVLTGPERAGLEAYAGATYFGHGKGNVHCAGDSLTRGYPNNMSNGQDWPTLLDGLLGAGWSTQNNGQVAWTLSEVLATFGPTIDPDRDEWRDVANGGLGDFVISQGGTNNILPGTHNQSAATAMAEQVTNVSHWKTRGFTVLATTIPHVGTVGESSEIPAADMATFNARADTYNASMLAGDSGADGVIDWSTGEFSDPANATYFYSGDRVHFEAPLNAVAAQRAADLITDPDPEEPPPMADSKITDLASLTTPATADLIEVVDVSDTTMASSGTNKKITVADLIPLAGLADPNADRIVFWDDSAGAYAYLTAGSGLTITGTSMTASGGGGGASSPLTLTATTASEVPLVTKGAASQTGHLFEVQDSTGTAIFQIDADGSLRRNDGTNMVIRSGGSLDVYVGNVHVYRVANSAAIGISPMIDNTYPLGATAARWSNVYGTYHTVCGNSAPADADIAANQLMLWFDSTNGAAKLKLKGKSANGTVVAGEVTLT